ncbi:aldehyde dehydrogenase family protein [Nonomuraea basaltis]|nr:aldehyde dehydrogenase family protein [Nonomuraea basaltis]
MDDAARPARRRAGLHARAAAKIVRDAAVAAGAPQHCVQWIDEEPSLTATRALMHHDGVATILATVGTGMVRAAYSAGKPALGVGAGNVPAYIEQSADLRQAVNDIVLSKAFDSGMICASEQAAIIDAAVYEDALAEFGALHAYRANAEEKRKLEEFLFGVTASGESCSQARLNPKLPRRTSTFFRMEITLPPDLPAVSAVPPGVSVSSGMSTAFMSAWSSGGGGVPGVVGDVVDVEFDVAEPSFGSRGVPSGFAGDRGPPAVQVPEGADRGGPALSREGFPVGGRAQPVVGDEVDKLVAGVEDQVGRHGVGPRGERATDPQIVHGGPADRRVDQRRRRQHHEVVEQRHSLGAIRVRAGRVDDPHQRERLHTHGGRAGVEDVQHVDRQPGLGGRDEEQPLWRRTECVELLAGEAHPRLVGATADTAVDVGVEVCDPRLAHGAGGAYVIGYRLRQPGQIRLGHRATALTRLGKRTLGTPMPLGLQADRPARDEPIAGGEEQDDVGERAGFGIAPRHDDHRLRHHRGHGGHQPPPTESGRHDAGGRDDEDRGHQPRDAAGETDRLLELRDLCPAEPLGRAHQVDDAVNEDQYDDRPTNHRTHANHTPQSANVDSGVRPDGRASVAASGPRDPNRVIRYHTVMVNPTRRRGAGPQVRRSGGERLCRVHWQSSRFSPVAETPGVTTGVVRGPFLDQEANDRVTRHDRQVFAPNSALWAAALAEG